MKLVAYYRQGNLGRVASQRAVVTEFISNNGGKLVADFTESEEPRMTIRPQLAAAITEAKRTGATLLIPRFGRLVNNPSVTEELANSGIKFIACDNPRVNESSIQMVAEIARSQSIEISRQTRDSLAAAKRGGQKLGSARPGHWKGREHKRGWKKGAKNSAEMRTKRAEAAYAFLLPEMQKMQDEASAIRAQRRKELKAKLAAIEKKFDHRIAELEQQAGSSPKVRSQLKALEAERDDAITAARAEAVYPTYDKIAEHLNAGGHRTTVGKPFTGVAVWRILQRQKSG